jgi:hypothetical protein
MKLHPKIKMICEEFADNYEWIDGDDSLFLNVRPEFIDIVKKHLETCPLEFVMGGKNKDNSPQHSMISYKKGKEFSSSPSTYTLWYRLPEEQEKSYDFEDEDDE